MSKKRRGKTEALAVTGKKPGLWGGRTFKTENFKRNLKTLRHGMDSLGSNVRKSVALMDAVLSYLEDNPVTNWDQQVEDARVSVVEQIPRTRQSSLAKGIIDLLHTPPGQELLGELVKMMKKGSGNQSDSERTADIAEPNPSITTGSSKQASLPKTLSEIQL